MISEKAKGLIYNFEDSLLNYRTADVQIQADKELREYIEQLEQNQQQWISVNDRLPDHEEIVILWFDSSDYKDDTSHGYYIDYSVESPDEKGGCWYWLNTFTGDYNDVSGGEVTHWTPLPSAPEQN